MTPQKAKTYVLIGYDAVDQIEYAQRDDVIIIRAKHGRSIKDAIGRIEPPANIILSAHGSKNGMFSWNRNEKVPYSELFTALPSHGIASIAITSCYGGSATMEKSLQTAPAGTLVLSLIGPNNIGANTFVKQFAAETEGIQKPIDLFLKVLDNFNPREYQAFTEYLNKRDGTNDDANPNNALPHIIGIGGKVPMRIDLNDELTKLGNTGKYGKVKEVA